MPSQTTSPSGGSTDGISIEREARSIVIKRHDAVVASSGRALLVHGVREAPVYYVPRDDVYMEHLTPSDDGVRDGLRFWSIVASGGGVADAVWMHEAREGGTVELDGYLGFDPAVFNATAA